MIFFPNAEKETNIKSNSSKVKDTSPIAVTTATRQRNVVLDTRDELPIEEKSEDEE